MNRSFAGLIALVALLSSAACSGLPKSLKAEVEAEEQQFASARREFETARNDVRQSLAKQPELAKMRGLLWQPALDRDTERFNICANQLKELRELLRQDRKNSRGEVQQLLHGEQRMRAETMTDVRAMQKEAQRFERLRSSLPELDRQADQLAATDLHAVTTLVAKAETDWPEKKTDLEHRLEVIKQGQSKATTDWKAARKSGGDHPDFAVLFPAEEALQSEAAALSQQPRRLNEMTGHG